MLESLKNNPLALVGLSAAGGMLVGGATVSLWKKRQFRKQLEACKAQTPTPTPTPVSEPVKTSPADSKDIEIDALRDRLRTAHVVADRAEAARKRAEEVLENTQKVYTTTLEAQRYEANKKIDRLEKENSSLRASMELAESFPETETEDTHPSMGLSAFDIPGDITKDYLMEASELLESVLKARSFELLTDRQARQMRQMAESRLSIVNDAAHLTHGVWSQYLRGMQTQYERFISQNQRNTEAALMGLSEDTTNG